MVVLLLALLPSAHASEQLVVFTQSGADSEVAKDFDKTHLPKIKALADEMGLAFIVKDVTKDGSPAEVGITPLVVYQNHAGRSVYQGRYTTLDRVSNFVTTARFMPQGADKRQLEDAIGMRTGKATVVLPLKVTDLAGAKPEGYDHAAFAALVKDKFATTPLQPAGMLGDVALGRSDRLFYVDIYPYRSEDGTLYLSLALFSQFHCHEPVFTQMDEPISGPWDQRGEVITRAVREMNQQVAANIRRTTYGDGFDAVPTDTKAVTWEAIGLPLPPKPEGAVAIDPADVKLVDRWAVDVEAQSKRPAVTFAFPAPLDGYAGRAKKLTGELTLGEGLKFAGAKGKFVVPVNTVTMGESDLDNHVHGDLLRAAKFPDSDFTFDKIEAGADILVFGEVIPAKLVGRFTMKGVTIPLTVPASIEAFVGTDGKPRVSVSGAWEVDLSNPFNIAGPDGPEDVKDTLNYRCHIVLKPAE